MSKTEILMSLGALLAEVESIDFNTAPRINATHVENMATL